MPKRKISWTNWLLFIATIFTTLYAGAQQRGIDLTTEPDRLGEALPYALALLGILGVHELGHYFTARYHKIVVSPPYFIPVPFGLGTFGAFIKMKSQALDRKGMFDVAVAGPLAGLLIALPVTVIGLRSSIFIPAELTHLGGTEIGSSILLALLTKFNLGSQLPLGCSIYLGPLAFAGWIGLVVTALNLIPVGQLDGGHIAGAMFGTRLGRVISKLTLLLLFSLALTIWPDLLTWAIVAFFLGGKGAPPINDITPISGWRYGLGALAFIILILIICPAPTAFMAEVGLKCP